MEMTRLSMNSGRRATRCWCLQWVDVLLSVSQQKKGTRQIWLQHSLRKSLCRGRQITAFLCFWSYCGWHLQPQGVQGLTNQALKEHHWKRPPCSIKCTLCLIIFKNSLRKSQADLKVGEREWKPAWEKNQTFWFLSFHCWVLWSRRWGTTDVTQAQLLGSFSYWYLGRIVTAWVKAPASKQRRFLMSAS